MSDVTIQNDPDIPVTEKDLVLLTELLVLKASRYLIDKRGLEQLDTPLEVLGLLTLMTGDAWKDISHNMKAKYGIKS